jgi:uncharacterized membrane protein HdeD (DUF308 family)
MTAPNPSNDTASQLNGYMTAMADHWGLLMAMGILSVIIGIMAVVWPGITLLTVAILFAVWLLVGGIVELIHSFTRDGDTGSRVLHAIIGLLSIIVGFALLRTPFQSLEVLIFVIGIFWIAQGIITFVTAFQTKQGRGWRLFMGGLGVVAGIIVLTYPISSAVTLAIFGGIWLVVLGFMQIYAAWKLRQAAKAGGAAAPTTPTAAPAA